MFENFISKGDAFLSSKEQWRSNILDVILIYALRHNASCLQHKDQLTIYKSSHLWKNTFSVSSYADITYILQPRTTM